MDYRQTLDFLYSQLPLFQRIGAAAYKPNLNNTYALLKACGNPHEQLKCIHIAGTNGKGSTSHMLASILQEAGYKTGLYTSPHLKDFRERIKINGKMIPREYVVRFVEKHRSDFASIKPSFFEMTVALCFSYFRDKKTDISVIETGLGGRLDSTNVVHPLLSIITNISFDHTQLLGDSLEKIALEKAGIIKNGVPALIGESHRETRPVFLSHATMMSASITFADKKKIDHSYNCELKGKYQEKNINTVLHAVQLLKKSDVNISEKNIRNGLSRVVRNTGLCGRWQTLQKSPKVIADIGHNQAGIKEVVAQLKKEQFRKLHIVIGTVNDKDISAMLKQLPRNAEYYFTKAKIPRALNEKELAEIAHQHGLKGYTFPTVKKAVNAAKKSAAKNDLIFIGGSAFVVAEAL